jgi:isopenicillin N synthase-like dioxygenase
MIDMAPLFGGDDAARANVAAAIRTACEAHGFFYVTGHRVAPDTVAGLDTAARRFFALPESKKAKIAMAKAGRAWRGFFPVGGELTSGLPDLKEGLYLGTDLPPGDPRVRAGVPMHGANLWPEDVPELRGFASRYMTETARAAAALMQGVSLSLGLPADWFARTYTAEPTVLFRLFHYPPSGPPGVDWSKSWSVGEHSDYGLLTLLAQDDAGGLEVKGPNGWIAAPPIDGTLVCNIGDMLELMTGGRYVSTPHRVMNTSGRSRLSFPLFFDPAWDAPMRPLPGVAVDASTIAADRAARWDAASVHLFEGTYGDYLLAKVGKVFPGL